ncbi:glycosyltransferase [Thalassospiraceae bacterium SW-3-3]|nr:glycosyltransferase [Thalassospiraceae bacterium SW-3-3]
MSLIIIFARKLDQGGAERQIVTLAKGLRNDGQNVHVVLFYSGGKFDNELVSSGVPLHHIGKRGRWDIFGFLFRMTKTFRKLRPTIIYSFLDIPNILSVLLYPISGRPKLIWSIRAAEMEMHHYDWLNRFVSKLETILSGAPHKTIANSQAGKDWAIKRGFPAQKIAVIENGIDTRRFKFEAIGRDHVRQLWNIGKNEIVLGLVARLDAMKDIPNFLKACSLLDKRHDGLRFVCIGSGPSAYQSRLASYASELGIAERLIWAGSQSDMPATLSALDLVVSSSLGEGFSNAIAEAMACERPCVVTNVGDSARIVSTVGEIVPPRDSTALATAISKILVRNKNDPSLGKQSRARILEEFSVSRMIERTKIEINR